MNHHCYEVTETDHIDIIVNHYVRNHGFKISDGDLVSYYERIKTYRNKGYFYILCAGSKYDRYNTYNTFAMVDYHSVSYKLCQISDLDIVPEDLFKL